MKKFLLTAIILAFAGLAFSGSVEKTFKVNDPEIIQKGKYQLIAFKHSMNTAIAGNPALPYISVRFLLPPGEEATEIEFIGMEETKIEGSYKIYPYQPSRPVSSQEADEFVINDELYSNDHYYPETQTGKLLTSFMNGYGIAMSSFSPVKYNPVKGEVVFYKKVMIRITTKPSVKAEEALKNLNQDVEDKILSFTDNNKAINQYISQQKTDDDYSLLIISPNQFETEYDSLRDVYLRRGIPSEFCSVEDINTNMSGQDTQEKIRNYIIQEYQDHGINHVLLGGDVEHIPYRGFYCYVQSGSGYQDDNIPADLYYSALDGSWNNDNDNLWGEIGEDDLLPDISVARLPFSTTGDLQNMLHKVISYQETPVTGELQHPLMAGEHLYSNPLTWGADYLDLLIGYQDENGYTTIGIPDDDSITNMYDRNSTWSSSDIINEINLGHSFIHHSGHSNSNYTMRLYSSDITNSNFPLVNGIDHNYTLVYTHGCICGAFDDNDCIAEHMLFIDNFVVAGAFNSRYGWFNEGQTEGPSAHLHREFTDALYNEKIDRIGATHLESKIQTSPWVTAPGQWEEGALRWCFYDCNILGDPAMPVWTDEPVSIDVTYPSAITIGTDSININVSSSGNPMNNFNCTFFMDTIYHGMGTTDSLGNACIFFDPPLTEPGDAELIVSGYNCLPHTYAISVSPAAGAYIIYQDHTIHEITGNPNGQPEYGEDCYLEILMQNAGAGDATDVDVSIYNNSNNWITITDSTEYYGNIPAGTSMNVPEGFRIEVADNVPDQTYAEIIVEAEDDSKEIWNSSFLMLLSAPELQIDGFCINDSIVGNSNGVLDPGETAIISIEVMNTGHSDGKDAWVELHTANTFVSITDTMYYIGNLPVGMPFNALFEITLDESIPLGEDLVFDCSFISGSYVANESFSSVIGIMVEDFETGDFSKFEWQFAGSENWSITSNNIYEGQYSAQSGNISHDQTSELFISMNILAEGELSFYSKVSSEKDWDFLHFSINGEIENSWSGEEDWQQHTYDVSTGNHKFSWTYAKDGNTSNGSDKAWLDYIVFPPADYLTITDEKNKAVTPMAAYPNPCSGILNIGIVPQKNTSIQLEIIDMQGKSILKTNDLKGEANHPVKYKINTSSFGNGVFLIKCIIDDQISTCKFINSIK